MITRTVISLALAMSLNQSYAADANNGINLTDRTDRIVVRYHDKPTQGNAMAFIKQGVTHGSFGVAAGKRKDVLEIEASLSNEDVKILSEGLTDDPQVAYAEPDYFMQTMQVPNDPYFNQQWHYMAEEGINLPTGWKITTGSPKVVIGVVDTGIVNHRDIRSNILSGYDFISNAWIANDGNGRDNNPADPGDSLQAGACGSKKGQPVPNQTTSSSWHGTHVSGTIAATSNNGIGVSGVAWESKILPLRALGRCGGYASDIIDAMRWAAGLNVYNMSVNPNPVKVLNLSLGGTSFGCPRSYQDAINEITSAGVTVVVAAGNSNQNAFLTTPANCNNVVTVGAIDRGGDRSQYSNYGSFVDIAAPGGETFIQGNGVLSTANSGETSPLQDNYEYYQGTSMATPHVAGVAALIYALRPNITPARLEQLMKDTARSFSASSSCSTTRCGAGILDAAAVLKAVQNEPIN